MGGKPFPNTILKVSSSGTNLWGRWACCLEMFPHQEKSRLQQRNTAGSERCSAGLGVAWGKGQMMLFRFPKAGVEGKIKPQFPHGSPAIAGWTLQFYHIAFWNEMASSFPYKGEGNDSIRINSFRKMVTFKGNGWVGDQDGGVGGSWTHLLPQTPQGCNYRQSNPLWESSEG